MFTASAQLNVTLICGPTDMRKAIDGLEHLSIQISPRQLNWLLDGLALNLQDAHPHLTYRYHDD